MFERLVLRKILDIPAVYAAFQKMIAKKGQGDSFLKNILATHQVSVSWTWDVEQRIYWIIFMMKKICRDR